MWSAEGTGRRDEQEAASAMRDGGPLEAPALQGLQMPNEDAAHPDAYTRKFYNYARRQILKRINIPTNSHPQIQPERKGT